MKKWERILCLLLICGCAIAAYFYVSMSAAAEDAEDEGVSATGDIIVLLDSSGSMNWLENPEEAIAWVYNIAALCMDTDITLTVIEFKAGRSGYGPKILMEDEIMTEQTMESLRGKLLNVKFSGDKTDHLEAIRKAVELLEEKESDGSMIVIVSDGDLDYKGRTKGDTSEKDEEETEAVEKFQEICKTLAAAGHRIYLIEFQQDVEMFQITEDGKAVDGIETISKDTSASEILKKIYEDAGFEIESVEDTIEKPATSFTFSLEEACDQLVINIEFADATEADSDIIVYFMADGGEEEQKDTPVYRLTRSALICFENPKTGTYTVKFSDSCDAAYTLHLVDKPAVFVCSVRLLDMDGNELQMEGTASNNEDDVDKDDDEDDAAEDEDSDNNLGLVTYLSESETVHLEVEVDGEGFESGNITKFCYELKGDLVDLQWEEESDAEDRHVSSADIALSSGTNRLIVVLEVSEKEVLKTVLNIRYEAETEELSDGQETLKATVGAGDSLSELLSKYGITYDIDKAAVYVDGVKIDPGSSSAVCELKVNSYITFLEVGDYDLLVAQDGERVSFIVVVESEDNANFPIWMIAIIIVIISFAIMLVCRVARRN